MRVTDEMVEAACAVFVRAYEPDRVPHSSDLIRSAIEAALAAAPQAEPVQEFASIPGTNVRVRLPVQEPVQEPVADRAAFERHAERLGYSVDPDTREGREGGYWSSHTQLMWLTWQAALAEPVQEEEGLIEFLADLQRSRMKYPNNRRMFDGLMSEVDELRRAYAGDGDIRAEAFDVAVCAFRIATEGDSGGNTMLKQAQPVQEPGFWGRDPLEAALAAAPQWVSCAERLPEAGVEVLVWLAAPVIKHGCQIAIDTWDEQHEAPVAWSSATIPIGEGWDSGADWQDITHWMPLPAAPGGEE